MQCSVYVTIWSKSPNQPLPRCTRVFRKITFSTFQNTEKLTYYNRKKGKYSAGFLGDTVKISSQSVSLTPNYRFAKMELPVKDVPACMPRLWIPFLCMQGHNASDIHQ